MQLSHSTIQLASFDVSKVKDYLSCIDRNEILLSKERPTMNGGHSHTVKDPLSKCLQILKTAFNI